MWWCFQRSGHASRGWDGRACNASAHASPLPTSSFSSISTILTIYPASGHTWGLDELLLGFLALLTKRAKCHADNPPTGQRQRRRKAQIFGVSPYADRFPNLPFSGPIFQWGITVAHRTLYVVGCRWVSLGAVGCRWMLLDVIGCRWMSLGVVGCH